MKPFQNIIVLKALLFFILLYCFIFHFLYVFTVTYCYLWFILDFNIFDGFLNEFDFFFIINILLLLSSCAQL